MANIAFYGSHNAAVVVEKDGEIVTVIELERFLTKKNAGHSQYLISYSRKFLLKLFHYIPGSLPYWLPSYCTYCREDKGSKYK